MTGDATTVPLLRRSEVIARPRFEGSNICTWIGFKHVMYLIEEAVLEHLRRSGRTPRRLYEEYDLGVEIVDSDARILTALHMDDVVHTEVLTQAPDERGAMVFRTETFVARPDRTKAVTATVRVLLRAGADPLSPVPRDLLVHQVDTLGEPQVLDELDLDHNATVWTRRIPYFYCHFSQRLQHSGYLRLMEEVVDVFLAERGISIRTMLDSRGWIPVVPRAQVRLLGEAMMEEEIVTVLTVEEIFKRLTYTARMDCYVRREGRLVHTATGRITHGYAAVLDRKDWALVPFDDDTLAALRGRADR